MSHLIINFTELQAKTHELEIFHTTGLDADSKIFRAVDSGLDSRQKHVYPSLSYADLQKTIFSHFGFKQNNSIFYFILDLIASCFDIIDN